MCIPNLVSDPYKPHTSIASIPRAVPTEKGTFSVPCSLSLDITPARIHSSSTVSAWTARQNHGLARKGLRT
ncbi:MAG: hypothetical protein K5752_09485, partial [Succinivibrionaceae bacterium]|nr:hypothetical protein [Succinivibrionaceae bacterium]